MNVLGNLSRRFCSALRYFTWEGSKNGTHLVGKISTVLSKTSVPCQGLEPESLSQKMLRLMMSMDLHSVCTDYYICDPRMPEAHQLYINGRVGRRRHEVPHIFEDGGQWRRLMCEDTPKRGTRKAWAKCARSKTSNEVTLAIAIIVMIIPMDCTL